MGCWKVVDVALRTCADPSFLLRPLRPDDVRGWASGNHPWMPVLWHMHRLMLDVQHDCCDPSRQVGGTLLETHYTLVFIAEMRKLYNKCVSRLLRLPGTEAKLRSMRLPQCIDDT